MTPCACNDAGIISVLKWSKENKSEYLLFKHLLCCIKMGTSDQASPLLCLQNISKSYGAMQVLSDVNINFYKGEVHAILGENGAGKSTLMKIISGVIRPTQGSLSLNDVPIHLKSPGQAIENGLVCMFQELSLVPDLSVKENLLLGGKTNRFGFVSSENIADALHVLHSIDGRHISLDTLVKDLTLAEQQQVEIAKAISKKPQLLILDESTSALNASVVEKLFALVNQLRQQGMAILFISHRFHEIQTLADTISVFRNGELIDTFANGTHDYPAIIQMMVGQSLTELFPKKTTVNTDNTPPLLSLRNYTWGDAFRNVSFDVHAGQIIGLGGLDGQGQSEVLLGLFGILKNTRGDVIINDNSVQIKSPKHAKGKDIGFALVPPDRRTEALILQHSIKENMEQAVISSGVTYENNAPLYDEFINSLSLKYRDLEQQVSTLSGGNQQKVALIKWLVLAPNCILLADPTRGIDVKTKTQIYQLMVKLAKQGTAIVLMSTDYEELIHLCHKAHIFYEGTIVKSLKGDTLTAQNIISASLNVSLQQGDKDV